MRTEKCKNKSDARVHGNTTGLGEVVLLRLGSVEGTTSLEHGLVDTSTTGNDTDRGARERRDRLLGAGRETDAGAARVVVVTDDGRVVARSARERTTVTGLLLDVADDGTFREGSEGEDVADGEGGLLAAEDKGAGREALGGDEGLSAHLVAVRVAEDDTGERRTTAREGPECQFQVRSSSRAWSRGTAPLRPSLPPRSVSAQRKSSRRLDSPHIAVLALSETRFAQIV